MVTVREGAKEVRESNSRVLHRMEAGLIAAYDWISGPPMSDLQRDQQKVYESEGIRRYYGL